MKGWQVKPDELKETAKKSVLSSDELSKLGAYELGELLKEHQLRGTTDTLTETWHVTSKDEHFMRDCWYRTSKNKDYEKCEHCSYRFKCYTNRELEIDDSVITSSGVTDGNHTGMKPPLKIPRLLP